jgi:hypothetical protein
MKQIRKTGILCLDGFLVFCVTVFRSVLTLFHPAGVSDALTRGIGFGDVGFKNNSRAGTSAIARPTSAFGRSTDRATAVRCNQATAVRLAKANADKAALGEHLDAESRSREEAEARWRVLKARFGRELAERDRIIGELRERLVQLRGDNEGLQDLIGDSCA